MNGERLRTAYQEFLARQIPERRKNCASPEALLGLVERTESEPSRLATLDHVMSCGACRPEFEMLRALAQATQASDRSRRPLWLALAAMVTLVVGVGLWWNARRPPDGTEVMRGPESSIQLISSGRAENNAIRFLWHSAPGARLYRVEITTPGGSLIYGVSTTDTVLSASSVGPLVPGSEYLWWVSATLATGGTIRSSVIPLRLRR